MISESLHAVRRNLRQEKKAETGCRAALDGTYLPHHFISLCFRDVLHRLLQPRALQPGQDRRLRRDRSSVVQSNSNGGCIEGRRLNDGLHLNRAVEERRYVTKLAGWKLLPKRAAGNG